MERKNGAFIIEKSHVSSATMTKKQTDTTNTAQQVNLFFQLIRIKRVYGIADCDCENMEIMFTRKMCVPSSKERKQWWKVCTGWRLDAESAAWYTIILFSLLRSPPPTTQNDMRSETQRNALFSRNSTESKYMSNNNKNGSFWMPTRLNTCLLILIAYDNTDT